MGSVLVVSVAPNPGLFIPDNASNAQAEQAAQLSAETFRWRRLYEALLANTPDLGYIFDLNHRFTYANHALLAMWGRTWDEAIGKTCLELGYEPWHAAMHDREIEQVIATKKSIRGEVPFNGASGRRIYDYIFFPVLGASGEVEAVGGTTRDITDRKRAESLLSEQKQLLELIVAGCPLEQSLAEITAAVQRLLPEAHADEPGEWESSIGQLGAHIAGIAIERDRATQALRESEQRLAADLADMRQLQSISAAISSEEDTQALYDKLLDAAVSITRSDFASMQMLYPERGKAGELRLLAYRGFSPHAVRFWEWVRADSTCSCGAALRARARVVVPDIEQCNWLAGTADQQSYRQSDIRSVQSTPLISRGGKLVGMISTHWRIPHEPSERELRMLDILARQASDLIDRKLAADLQKQADAALRKSERFAAAGRMAAMVAHEINNPLEAMVNLWFLLGQESLTPDGELRHKMLGEELARVSHITKQTLEFYRDGQAAGPFDLSAAINAAIDIFSRKAEVRHAKIETRYRASANIFGFSGELRQVFANLIGNALEAGATSIKIRISRGREHDGQNRPGVRVLIADNGSGIPKDLSRKVFEPFFTTKEEKGTGLGLWVSRGIIHKHDGWMRVRTSTQPGRSGATFCLFLPALQPG